MDKLVFKPKFDSGKEVENRIRIKPEAMVILRVIANSTGQNISYIASEMIKFAFKHTQINPAEGLDFEE